MSYDFDRFADALQARASQMGNESSYPYMCGYMNSLLKEIYHRYPDVAERITDSTKFLEDLITHDRVYGYSEDEVALDKPL